MRESLPWAGRFLPRLLLACALGAIAYTQYRTLQLVVGIDRRLTEGVAAVQRTSQQPLPKEPIALAKSASLGAVDAPAVLMVYSDFECPFCARFSAEALSVLRRDYVADGRLRIVFRHMPLTRIHPNAQAAATASICAAEQNRFWEMHDALFARSNKLNSGQFTALGVSLGLNKARFERCYERGAQEQISTDVTSARQLGVIGTPTVFLGRGVPGDKMQVLQRLASGVSAQQLASHIDALLSPKS